MDRIVAVSDRVYRMILRVYPRVFRDEYEEEMVLTMRDQVRESWARNGGVGVTALWLRVLLDTSWSALVEHAKQGWGVSLSWRGLGYGLAVAVGYPLAFVSFIAWSGELVGFETAENWLLPRRYLYPVFAGPGFVLVGIGLRGLYRRLEVSKPATIRCVALGVGLGLAGIAGVVAGISGPSDYFAGFTIPAAFVLITVGLASMGGMALRKRAFGLLSFVPLAAAASAGVWFFSLRRQLSGGFHNVFQTSATIAHITMWFILGLLLWASPPENTSSVARAHGSVE
jgi:hypothetical protein